MNAHGNVSQSLNAKKVAACVLRLFLMSGSFDFTLKPVLSVAEAKGLE